MKNLKHYQSGLLFFISFLSMAEPPRLDELAVKHGTDKSSKWHNYTPIYETYFEFLRELPIKFLEIGFYHGNSALMWQDYFENGDLYFIDIDRAAQEYTKNLSSRCHLHFVDQANVKQLKTFIGTVGGDFDIILDDGGHTMVQQITSFETLFPYVKSGGLYIIEDLHTSYKSSYYNTFFGGSDIIEPYNSQAHTTINFVKNLIDAVNYIGGKTFCADTQKCPADLAAGLTIYQKEIASIHIYGSLVFIFKK